MPKDTFSVEYVFVFVFVCILNIPTVESYSFPQGFKSCPYNLVYFNVTAQKSVIMVTSVCTLSCSVMSDSFVTPWPVAC